MPSEIPSGQSAALGRNATNRVNGTNVNRRGYKPPIGPNIDQLLGGLGGGLEMDVGPANLETISAERTTKVVLQIDEVAFEQAPVGKEGLESLGFKGASRAARGTSPCA